MKYLGFVIFNLWKVYIGIIFISTLLILYPIFLILLSKEKWKPLTFKVNIFWSRLVRILCFYFVRTYNKPQIPHTPFIICANHTSFLDIFFMYSILPEHKFVFLGKSEILKYPLLKTFFKKLNIPVFRDDRIKAAKSFISCKQALQNGWSLVIFPEGSIPDDNLPVMIPFKDGAFKLAKSTNVPIVSLTFRNNYRLFSDPENIFGHAYPGISHVHFHPIISKEFVADKSVTELKDYCFELINSPFKKTND